MQGTCGKGRIHSPRSCRTAGNGVSPGLERRIVLAEAVAEMRRQGKRDCDMTNLLMDFKGIQVTLAVMSQALIAGRIDCKTAGRLLVDLQTMSKLLRMHCIKALPRIDTNNTDLRDRTMA